MINGYQVEVIFFVDAPDADDAVGQVRRRLEGHEIACEHMGWTMLDECATVAD